MFSTSLRRRLASAGRQGDSAVFCAAVRLQPAQIGSRRSLLDFLASPEGLLHTAQLGPSKEPFFVLNKPYGVPVYGYRHAQAAWRAQLGYDSAEEKVGERDDGLVSFASVAGDLAAQLGVEALLPVVSPPRYCSGNLVVATSPATQRRASVILKVHRTQGPPTLRLLCLCAGAPEDAEAEGFFHYRCEIVAGTLQTLPYYGDPGEVSKRSRALRKIRRSLVRHRVLGEANGASLVELGIVSFDANLHRAYLASLGAPIIGDWAYGRRVSRLLGQTILLEPAGIPQAAAPTPPPQLAAAWALREGDYATLPFFTHLAGVEIPGLFRRRKGLRVSAPLPDHFRLALHSLGLSHCITES